MLASKFGCVDVARLLIERNADPNKRNNVNETALILATESEHFEIVRLLLQSRFINNGLDFEVRDNNNGFTALILAALKQHTRKNVQINISDFIL